MIRIYRKGSYGRALNWINGGIDLYSINYNNIDITSNRRAYVSTNPRNKKNYKKFWLYLINKTPDHSYCLLSSLNLSVGPYTESLSIRSIVQYNERLKRGTYTDLYLDNISQKKQVVYIYYYEEGKRCYVKL